MTDTGLHYISYYNSKNHEGTLWVKREDVENVSFSELYACRILQSQYEKLLFLIGNHKYLYSLRQEEQIKNLIIKLKKELAQYAIPIWWLPILNHNLSRKEIIHITKGASIYIEQLLAMMLYAEELGYSYSEYYKIRITGNLTNEVFRQKFGLTQKNIDDTNKEFGNLSQGFNELHAKVLRRNEQWICIFFTNRGINNKEHYAYPHVHLITNTFGIRLEDWINDFKMGTEKQTRIHLTLR